MLDQRRLVGSLFALSAVVSVAASVATPHWVRWYPCELRFGVLPDVDWFLPWTVQIMASVCVLAAAILVCVAVALDLLDGTDTSRTLVPWAAALGWLGVLGVVAEVRLIRSVGASWNSQRYVGLLGPGPRVLALAAGLAGAAVVLSLLTRGQQSR